MIERHDFVLVGGSFRSCAQGELELPETREPGEASRGHNQTPTNQTTTNQTTTNRTPTNRTPTNHTPTNHTPTNQTPTNQRGELLTRENRLDSWSGLRVSQESRTLGAAKPAGQLIQALVAPCPWPCPGEVPRTLHDEQDGHVITFEDVSKTYSGQTKPALRHISLQIDKGEFVFLVGTSGSGKSTFLRLILREYRPTSGKIFVLGKDLGHLHQWKVPALRRQIGTVFQDFRLLPGKNVYENVAFGLQVLGRPTSQIRQIVPETIELVGLSGKEDRQPEELSGGEQQRVAIARAIVNQPKILIADEPTGNLDPQTSVGIMKLLDRINKRDTTVIMATHDQTIVDQMRKRVLELDQGNLVRDQARGVYGTA